jgi:1,4-alpha-glucan branching enzyme
VACAAVSPSRRPHALGERPQPVYRETPALYERDLSADGFEWIDCNDSEASVIAFMRKGARPGDVVVIVCNFTPVARDNYRVGVPFGGKWRERLNSDARDGGRRILRPRAADG